MTLENRMPAHRTARENTEIWGRVMAGASENLGREAVSKWIGQVSLGAVRGTEAELIAPTKFLASWVERNYGRQLLGLIQGELPAVRRVSMTVNAGETVRPAPKTADDGMPPTTHLNPRFTFESFIVGKPNELAHAAARRIADSADAVYNPVFLYGGVGLGKTHLMHAIGWQIHRARPACSVMYLSAEQFMYRFIHALREKETLAFKQQFRAVDVLMIDDVQFIAGKESTQEEFFHTFNALIDQKKQIVISADRSPDQIDGLQERICSRLQWGLVADIHPTDFELRVGILQAKADAMLEDDPSVEIEPKVLDYLAHRISSNVRVLEGALTRLFAFASLVGRRIDMDLTHECLADLLRASDRKVTIDEIKRRVAEHYSLRLSDLISQRRARAIARPRQAAMYLCKMLTTKSLPEIGRGFGGRDHTTVLHAVRKIEELRATDGQLDEDIELLRRLLEG